MKLNLNFIDPYSETATGKKEVKNRYCQGCFLWLPSEVFSEDSDICEDCLG